MIQARSTIKSLFLSAVLLFLAMTSESRAELPVGLAALLAQRSVPPESLSVYIKQVGHSSPLVEHLAEVPRNPASTMKLVTTAAALELLGPDYRWTTGLFVDGKLKNGTLKGDLILKGGGDPWLVMQRFWLLLRELQQRGLQRVDGDLLIDASLYDDTAIANQTVDGRIYRPYNTRPSAVLLNFAASLFRIRRIDHQLAVDVEPPAATLQIENRLKPLSGKCGGRTRDISMDVVSQNRNQTTVRFSGTYPPACGDHKRLRRVLPHHQYVYGVFRSLWQEMGGTLTGSWRPGSVPENSRLLVNFKSVPLTEVIKNINKFSNNVMSRNLLLTLAAEHAGIPAQPARGIRVIRDWLQKAGLEDSGFVIINGAGLSRDARLTARGLGQLLEHMHFSPLAAEFKASLPIAGADGSVRRRFRGVGEKGQLRLKTGVLRNVRAIAGYVQTAPGKTWVVVLLHNHSSAEGASKLEIQEHLIRWLYQQK